MKSRFPLLVVAVATSWQYAAFGQENETAPGTSLLEGVTITGSRIGRTNRESPQSVVILDRKRIEQSGARTLHELFFKLPQSIGGTNENQFNGGSFSPGAAGVSLRGLGLTSTLVLLNGRRVAPFPLPYGGTDTFVDLNGIPLSAIERVEILKEGASAIYGSDAIAGVVNIILKDRYDGFETETFYGNTTNQDASEFRQSFVSGIETDRLRLLLTGGYYHRNPISYADRGFSASGDKRKYGGPDMRRNDANPGTITIGPSAFAVPNGSDGNLTVGDFLPGRLADGSFRNRFDSNRDFELMAETERWGGLLTFHYDLAPGLELFGEASYQSVHSETQGSPTGINSGREGLMVPASNPFNPFGVDVGFRWLAEESGLRRDIVDHDAYRYVAGLRLLDLPAKWTAEVAFLYSESNVIDHSSDGFLSTSRVQAALNDPNPETALNVFGDGKGINNPATMRSLEIHPRTDGLAYLYGADFRASGELFDLPAGPVRLAFGGEYREEFLSQTIRPKLGATIGFGGVSASGSRDVRSLFIEGSIPLASQKQNLPLLRDFELTIAERFDDYSDFGDSTKPKFGFKWKPVDGLLVRGAYSEGFRAASLSQLFNGRLSRFEQVRNPRTGRVDTVNVISGGNPDLEPETSYSYFLGAVIEPPFIPGLTIGVDYYHIEQRNLINQPSTQDIVNGQAPGVVTYGAGDEISDVGALYTNLGEVVVEGVDVDLSYRFETRFGFFTLLSSLAYVADLSKSPTPGAPLVDRTDSYALPEFRMVNSLFYRRGGFEAGVTVNYTDSYDDEFDESGRVTHTIGSWTTVDLQCSYEWAKCGGASGWRRWLDDARLTIGCINVGDCEPPYAHTSEGYDPQTADAAGRFIYASFRKKFW